MRPAELFYFIQLSNVRNLRAQQLDIKGAFFYNYSKLYKTYRNKRVMREGASVKNQQKKNILLPTVAVIAVTAAVIVSVIVKRFGSDDPAVKVDSTGISIDTGYLDSTVRFIDYQADGIDLQVMAVQDATGAARIAYNTCQTCNGSPEAYFVQEGGYVVCQNCGVSHPINQLGDVKAGCNPIPVTNYTEEDGIIKMPASELAANAEYFTSWKKGK